MCQLTASKKDTIKRFKRKPTRELPNHSEPMKRKCILLRTTDTENECINSIRGINNHLKKRQKSGTYS